MKRLLFVCSGNTCRSPLAEGIAKKIFPESLLKEIEISSAGSSAVEGLPASPQAIQIAQKNDIDIANHRTRLLSKSLVREADLIVTMSAKQRGTVGVIDPQALEHSFLLAHFCDGVEGDIPDPIGKDIESYEETFELIKECLIRMRDLLVNFEGWKK